MTKSLARPQLSLHQSGPSTEKYFQVTEIRGDDQAFLRTTTPVRETFRKTVRIADLFCGAGGLSLGAHEAARSLRFNCDVVLASDIDEAAADCFEANFSGAEVIRKDLRTYFSAFDARLNRKEIRLRELFEGLEFLMGGPPCQGHSDLNNYSRRDDPKNALYGVMSRAAKVLRPRHVLIENVPGAFHDANGIVQRTAAELNRLGYAVDIGLADGLRLGVPQNRSRLILLASLVARPSVQDILMKYSRPERSLSWAIQDLAGHTSRDDFFNSPANTTPANRRRVDFLFENGLWDLPDSERPPCHQAGGHSYKSVYGRLHWDKPAPTITTAFFNMSSGRFIHPRERRTLTAHEAARLQFFPDFFDFSPAGKRTAMARVIGNAVPSKLAYPFVRELLQVSSYE